MTEGNKATAQRMVNANKGLIASIMIAGGIDEEDARKVASLYIKSRIVKMDAVLGTYHFKHGAFLDADVIANALEA